MNVFALPDIQELEKMAALESVSLIFNTL
jgi:hypothetical protein